MPSLRMVNIQQDRIPRAIEGHLVRDSFVVLSRQSEHDNRIRIGHYQGIRIAFLATMLAGREHKLLTWFPLGCQSYPDIRYTM